MPRWQPMDLAPENGELVWLKHRDSLGTYEVRRDHFLHSDGEWYLVDPPTKLAKKPIAWSWPD